MSRSKDESQRIWKINALTPALARPYMEVFIHNGDVIELFSTPILWTGRGLNLATFIIFFTGADQPVSNVDIKSCIPKLL
jgi:hypothetical protein